MRAVLERVACWLDRWAGPSINRRIAVGALAAGAAGLLVNVANVARDLLIAYRFGRADEVDAFLIAFLVPSLIVSVLGSAFESGVVPVYIRVRELRGRAASLDLLATAMALLLGLVLFIAAVAMLGLPRLLPHLATGFDPAKIDLTRSYFCWLVPVILIGALTASWTALMNASERFWTAAIVPATVPLFTALSVILTGTIIGADSLILGTVAGFAAHAACLGVLLHRRGLLVLPRVGRPAPELREAVGQYLPLIFGAGIMALNTFVDQIVAARLSPGSVAALSYARKVPNFTAAALAAALGAAVLPHFAKMVARGAFDELLRTVRRFSALTFLTAGPVAAGVIVFSAPLVRLVFERGSFTAADTAFVGPIQALYALQIPFYVCATLAVRALSASGLNQRVMRIAIVNFVLNVVLTITLSHLMGARGIALASSIVMIVSAGQIYFNLWLHYRTHSSAAQPNG